MTFGVVLSEASERKDKAEKEAIIYVVEFWRASAACCICPQTSGNIYAHKSHAEIHIKN